MMATLNKHLPWIQLVILIGGMLIVYGQQVESNKSTREKAERCSADLERHIIDQRELVKEMQKTREEMAALRAQLEMMRR